MGSCVASKFLKLKNNRMASSLVFQTVDILFSQMLIYVSPVCHSEVTVKLYLQFFIWEQEGMQTEFRIEVDDPYPTK